MGKDIDSSLDRARGALLGAAVGDSMGAPCEGMSAEEIRATYGRITGFLRPESAGTDDTDFTLFNAYLLAQYGESISVEDVENEWRDKLLSGTHYYRPGGFSDVLATNNLREGMSAPLSGRFNHQMWSDGVAMSVAGVGVFAAGRPELAASLVETLGAVSNGRDGIYTGQAVAAAISLGMEGASPREMVDVARSVIPQDSWTARALSRACALASAFQKAPTAVQAPTEDEEAKLAAAIERDLVLSWWPWADLSTEAVPVAFAFFLAYQGEFQRVVPASIAIGRDADTIGAIVGSLAGSHVGASKIPAEWRERVKVSQGKSIGFISNKSIAAMAEDLVRKGEA